MRRIRIPSTAVLGAVDVLSDLHFHVFFILHSCHNQVEDIQIQIYLVKFTSCIDIMFVEDVNVELPLDIFQSPLYSLWLCVRDPGPQF